MAIGKVTKYTVEELEEDEAYRARPQWMKFYYAAWLLSTARFDEEQCGWYIRLLTWAASEGDFPGYIIEDEDEIKAIAGFRELSNDVYFLLSMGVQVPVEVLNTVKTNRLAKWKKVRNKFSSSTLHPGYISNRKLVKCLQEAYQQQRNAVKAGRTRAEQRYGKTVEKSEPKVSRTDEILAPAITPEVQRGTALSLDDEPDDMVNEYKAGLALVESNVNALNKGDHSARLADAIAPLKNSAKNGLENEEKKPWEIAVNKEVPSGRLAIKIPGSRALSILSLDQDSSSLASKISAESEREEITLISQPLHLVKSSDQDSNLSGSTKENAGNMPAQRRRRKAPEIIFREEDFEITLEMSLYIKNRWPYLDTGDCQYMAEKFKLVFHNVAKSSWKRTFYNFIDNQLVKYRYKPGDYKVLMALLEQQKGNNNAGAGQSNQTWSGQNTKPWESAAERNARLEREADERLRQLQGTGADSDTKNPPWLSLPTD